MVPKKSLNPIQVGILTGPTATGKSGLALELAHQNGNIEIINADSMLVYRGMDIGTAKPTPEELKKVPHHLVNIRNPDEPFTAGDFSREAHAAIEDIHSRGKRALIVGGTGFYLKSLLFGIWDAPAQDPEIRKELDAKESEELFEQLQKIDPPSATRIGKSDRYRLIRALELVRLTGKSPTELQANVSTEPDPRFALWILDRPNPQLYSRIEQRTEAMLNDGLVAECQEIQSRYPKSRALMAIGYAQVCDYLAGILPAGRKMKPGLAGLNEEIQLATRQLVKQQRTWFRNQKTKVSQALGFQLDQDISQVHEVFKSMYDD